MWSVIRGGTGGLNFLEEWYLTEGKSSKFSACREIYLRHQFPPLVGHLDLPITKTLARVLSLPTVMILKRSNESIFFQSNKFTACMVKDEKQVANTLMAFNILKILHPFQCKKHLRTNWKLSCNPQEYLTGY